MPIHKEHGGWEWGNHGHVYHGKNAKEKAEKQAAAAHAHGYRGDSIESSGPVTDLDIAKAIRDGEIESPQKIGNHWLFHLRVTGTGYSHRTGLGKNKDEEEYVFRDPKFFLTDEFLEQCSGIPLIFEHPEDQPFLSTPEFRERSIGTVILPHIIDKEVWAIGKVFDEDAALTMQSTHISTSPAVSFDKADITNSQLKGGEPLRIEGSPSTVDHLAVVPLGVWDKGGDPTGIDIGDGPMAAEDDKEPRKDNNEEIPAWADAAFGKLAERFDAMDKRMDAFENKGGDREDSRKDESEEDRKKREEEDRADRARKDAEERERKDAEERARKDGEDEDAHQAAEELDRRKKEEEADKARKDAEESARADAANRKADRDRILALEAQIASMNREISPEEGNEIAQTQARADSLARSLNMNRGEVEHIKGESAISFRRRLAAKFQKFARTDDLKKADVRKADSTLLPTLERLIYADAAAAAMDPEAAGTSGGLYYEKREMLGRTVEIPHGDSGAFLSRHKALGYRMKSGFKTQFNGGA